MRCPVDLPAHLIRDAELYAPGRKGSEAVEWILSDYPRVVGELRQVRRQLVDLDEGNADVDLLLENLKRICRQILDL